MGPPRPQPRPPDARRQPGAGLAPDGERAAVLPRGPLGRRALDEGLVHAAVHQLVDPVADDPADDRADDVDPELVQVAADERGADRPGRVDRRAGDRRDGEVDGDERERDGQDGHRPVPLGDDQDDRQEDRREDGLDDQGADVGDARARLGDPVGARPAG